MFVDQNVVAVAGRRSRSGDENCRVGRRIRPTPLNFHTDPRLDLFLVEPNA
jgi:hypothetical protein